MASNQVSPTSPFAAGGKGFYPKNVESQKILEAKSKKTGTAGSGSDSSVFDPNTIAYSLTNEGAPYSRTNPPFIYPGSSVRLGTTNEVKNIKRGYIRRLTEFYTRLQSNNTQADNPSTLQNMRCNFQFNPENITRSMEANTDMQFFFNQEPSQLAQPIPGRAGFAFELLFNREAELHSGKYVGPDGKLIDGFARSDRLSRTPEFFINETYSPAWVTEIGVLADIMVLDDIVGQGLAKDIVQNISQGNFTLVEPTKSSETSDDTDKVDTEAASSWDSGRLKSFSANLGNKAFLVPTPVRILFSPWFMVEGFVMSYSVTFNKFTPDMIPSQAIVAIQMQALYVGFAQQKTFLTDMPATTPSETGSGEPDIPAPGTAERAVYDQTKAALQNYVAKAAHIQGKENALDLLDCFFANSNFTKEFNFIGLASDEGKKFYEESADKSKNGGGLYFTVKGEIKVWWDKHVSNASNSRQTTKTDASTGGTIAYVDGPPPAESGTDYSIYGTSASPFIATLDEIEVYYEQGKRSGGFDLPFDLLILGQIRFGNALRVVSGNWGYKAANIIGAVDTFRGDKGTPAMWKWTLKKPNKIPFKQDRFNVSLELTLSAKRYETIVESPQKIRGRWSGITADTDILFNNITPDRGYGVPPAVRGRTQ